MDGCPSRTLEKAHGSHSHHRRALRTECLCGCPSPSRKVLAGKAVVGVQNTPPTVRDVAVTGELTTATVWGPACRLRELRVLNQCHTQEVGAQA